MGVIWGEREGKYFCGRGLDGANQIDLVQENSFLAQRAWGRKRCKAGSPHEQSDMRDPLAG